MCVMYSYDLFVLLTIFQAASPERRIRDGYEVDAEKRYVVYLLRAGKSTGGQDWTCGGAIVSPSFVISAAACVEDVKHIYVIAGYKKFITSGDLEADTCITNTKKRVVITCVPKGYQIDYKKAEKWVGSDIAVLQVDTPYDFQDTTYEKYCNYIPAPIRVNYEANYQSPGIDAIVMGWGHANKYGIDGENHNLDTLHYAPTKILNQKNCIKFFDQSELMISAIEKYMICTYKPGNLNDKGEFILKSKADAQGCITKVERLFGAAGKMCDEDSSEIIYIQRGLDSVFAISEPLRKQQAPIKTRSGTEPTTTALRSPGICQNDHGGPLTTWVGSHEVLIGVATLYRIDKDNKCVGPYLFTSTHCNSAFLSCILAFDNNTEAQRRCDSSKEGWERVERRLTWTNDRHRHHEGLGLTGRTRSKYRQGLNLTGRTRPKHLGFTEKTSSRPPRHRLVFSGRPQINLNMFQPRNN